MNQETMIQTLRQYRQLVRQMRAVEDRLGEYVQAIEEFGLENPAVSQEPVQCREGLLPPAEILHRAGVLADQLEWMTAQTAAARDQVKTLLLRESQNLLDYQKLWDFYLDGMDDAV